MIAYITEEELRVTVRELADVFGWKVFCSWSSKHSPYGEFDLRLIRPPRYIVAELKTEKGRVSEEQRATLLLLQACPALEVFVWRPSDLDEIERILA